MNTPIIDFVKAYQQKNALRLHMPGHKGTAFLGMESYDITEIDGADVLYSPDGIIEESQRNASALFGTQATIYSCEGSSLSIRAMLYLALLSKPASRRILAARNAHKVFMSAAALLDFQIDWMFSSEDAGLISCSITPEALDARLTSMPEKPAAFYVTSPDYLGNIADLAGLAQVCHKHKVLLLCDNAHGAYLGFLPESMHPISLGADMCCDSAHKTLPVLTGGAYLHISKQAPALLSEHAKRAMALFASTSPSYLILQSLDGANAYLADNYPQRLQSCTARVRQLKEALAQHGFSLHGQEPLKITLAPKSYGYTGIQLSQYLLDQNIVCEFADSDFLVCMVTPEISNENLDKLEAALLALKPGSPITATAPHLQQPKKCLSPREAIFSPSETLPVSQCLGRVLASENVSCPPAIPILVCGEEIDESALALFHYYEIQEVRVTIPTYP